MPLNVAKAPFIIAPDLSQIDVVPDVDLPHLDIMLQFAAPATPRIKGFTSAILG